MTRVRIAWAALAAALAAGLAGSAAQAGSIYAKSQETGKTQPLFADQTARKVGDTLTIVINEQSKIENETNRKMDKKSSSSIKTGGTVDLANAVGTPVGKHIFDAPKTDLSTEAENKFDGQANFDSSRKVTDQITVTVQDVLPNGNMVVVGQRQREVEGDKQTVQISGVVRPIDVNFDNTILSDKVGDFHVVYKASGTETKFTRPNWLARFLNAINPF